jgi:hypothetical protein
MLVDGRMWMTTKVERKPTNIKGTSTVTDIGRETNVNYDEC